MMSGQISVRHATRTGLVAKVRLSPVLSVSEMVEGADVGAGACVASGCEVAVGVAVALSVCEAVGAVAVAAGAWAASGCEVSVGVASAHPASSNRTKPTIAYFITSLLSYVLT